MSKKAKVTIENIEADEIDQLRKTIRASWVTSVKVIYAFGKKHSRASIEASLEEIGLALTKKANAFTGAAKLGLSEKVDGKWVVCDGQVSRYARVCKYLNSLKIAVDDVEKALEGKTMTELVQNTKAKVEVTDEQFQQALKNIKTTYAASKLFDFGDETLPISQEAGLEVGANMAVVICDLAGHIVAIRRLAGDDDKRFREKVWSVGSEKEVATSNTEEGDVVNQAIEQAKAA